jgi:hypothetical protein
MNAQSPRKCPRLLQRVSFSVRRPSRSPFLTDNLPGPEGAHIGEDSAHSELLPTTSFDLMEWGGAPLDLSPQEKAIHQLFRDLESCSIKTNPYSNPQDDAKDFRKWIKARIKGDPHLVLGQSAHSAEHTSDRVSHESEWKQVSATG